MIILPEIPQGRRTSPRRRQTVVDERILTTRRYRKQPDEAHRKEVNNHHITWHDAQTSMMHVRFNETWHGKMHKTILQIKWSSICNELHIDKTPHSSYLVSILYMYPTILNVVKHGKR